MPENVMKLAVPAVILAALWKFGGVKPKEMLVGAGLIVATNMLTSRVPVLGKLANA